MDRNQLGKWGFIPAFKTPKVDGMQHIEVLESKVERRNFSKLKNGEIVFK